MHAPPALHAADPRRAILMDLYGQACAAVDGRRVVRAALAASAPAEDCWLLAIGKAAGSMTLGALDALGSRVSRALVVLPRGHADPELARWPVVEVHAGDHPVPGPASLAAGARVLEFAAAVPAGQSLLLLVSGGASSLVEAPAAGISAEDLAEFNVWALGAGIDIGVLNGLRRRLSRLKDGRLAAALAKARARALLISDVPGDDPAVIGSGLARASAAAAAPLPEALPPRIRALFERAGTLPPGGALPAEVVGTLGDALGAAARAADGQALTVRTLSPPASGDVLLAASRFAHELALGPEEVLLWGGETTVTLPPTPGRGGRNQQFALAAARLIAGHDDLTLLAAGSDGIDGASDDAGAIVDGETLLRGSDAGLDVAEALAGADAGRFLEASGDLLHTGPSGTNVGDLVIGLRASRPAADAEG